MIEDQTSLIINPQSEIINPTLRATPRCGTVSGPCHLR